MHRLRTAALAAVVGLALVLTGFSAPAQAASDMHLRVRPLVASADYLIYRQKLATGYSISFPADSTLYFVGRDRKRHLLTGFDPRGGIGLAGDTAVQQLGPDGTDPTDPATPKHLHWRDLRTGKQGDVVLAATDSYAGPSLHGWIVKRSTGRAAANGQPVYRVLTISTAGVVRDYGVPYPNGASFRISAGPKGLLTSPSVYSGEWADDSPIGDGRARYSPYAHFGSWRTLVDTRADTDFFCGSVSATHAGCAFEEPYGKRDGYALLSLKTGRLTWIVDHPKQCVFSAREAFGSALVGEAYSTSVKQHCVRGRLTALRADGTVVNSTRRWGVHSLATVGLGRVLVTENDQRAIYGLTSVNAKPQLIVRAQ